MRKLLLAGLPLLLAASLRAQTYTPVAVTGYVHDAVAETFPNSTSLTDTVLDGSAYIIYSQSFATGGGFGGGWPTSGLVSDAGNTRQWQLAPYTANNVLNVMRNDTRMFTLVTAAAYRRFSILAFSTEGPSQVNIMVDFVDGSTATFSNIALPDWFGSTTNVGYSGFGRATRTTNVTAVDGVPGNPKAYYLDLDLSCTDRKKPVKAIRFNNATTTGTNAPYPNAVFLAVAGQTDTQAITFSSTNGSCGSPTGSATIGVTGNSGPYTISWNTTPVQTTPTITNLAGGTYIASVTDANGCVTTRTAVIVQKTSPTSITATASQTAVCAGGTTQVSVTNVGGALATYNWTPGGATTASFTATPTITTTYSVIGTDTSGCPYSRQVTVTVNQVPAAPVVPNVQVCGGSTATAQVQSPQAGYTYNWYTAASGGTPVATGSSFTLNNFSGSATYYVSATSSTCTSPSRTQVNISLLPAAQANAGPDLTIVAGDAVQLNATASAGTYLWTPATGLSSATILNPIANPAVTTTYVLTATQPLGCTAKDTITITVLPYCVKVMNAFTPNGDGVNDVWKVFDGSCISSAKVSVYNRYGAQVYESNDYKNNWNGMYKDKPVTDGTYYYIITYKLINNTSVYLKGNVTILR